MALSEEDIDQIDSEAPNKAELEDMLHEHTDEYPGLEEVDEASQKRSEMIETAKDAIQNLSDAAKRDALETYLEENPDAVIVPAFGSYMRITDPEGKADSFVVSVMDDSPSMSVTSEMGTQVGGYDDDRDPTQSAEINQLDITPPRLEEAPDWVLPKIYDMVTGQQTLVLYTDLETAKSELRQETKRTDALIEDGTASANFEVNERQGNLVAEAGIDAKRPEQEAGWNVLNERAGDNRDPIPRNPSPDPQDITEEEAQLVRDRIKTCLESPHLFVDRETGRDLRPADFDKRVFFNQLLECEMTGYTAPRRNADNQVSGVTRPRIVSIIKRIAKDYGFQAAGTYVHNKPEMELDTGMPSMQPMTPPDKRKNERGGFNEEVRYNRPSRDATV
jgi:hypothetical protein